MTLTPAYGRDYKNKQEVRDAFYGNKDFQVAGIGGGGQYATHRELKDHGVKKVTIRYGGLKKALPLDV